ncbi:MAG: zinc-ribbon domain-containing protein [Clostridiales bacterium]|nr:zinc-ribbon domain-containing protein [Clostridiales bacterium]
MIRCLNCGSDNEDNMKFCMNCGSRIDSSTNIPETPGYSGGQSQPVMMNQPSNTGYPPVNSNNRPGLDVFCLIGFLSSFVGLISFGIVSLASLPLSIVGLVTTKSNGKRGKGMAIAGIVISAIGLCLLCALIIPGSNKDTSDTTTTVESTVESTTESLTETTTEVTTETTAEDPTEATTETSVEATTETSAEAIVDPTTESTSESVAPTNTPTPTATPTQKPKSKCKVLFDVDVNENILFSKYSVVMYVDGKKIATMKQGKFCLKTKTLKSGEHEILFTKRGDKSITGTTKINVTGDSTFKCRVNTHSDSIEICNQELLDHLESTKAVMPDVTEMRLDDALSTLSDLGFKNIYAKSDGWILVTDHWLVVKQNYKAGKKVGRTKKIILTCVKDG